METYAKILKSAHFSKRSDTEHHHPLYGHVIVKKTGDWEHHPSTPDEGAEGTTEQSLKDHLKAHMSRVNGELGVDESVNLVEDYHAAGTVNGKPFVMQHPDGDYTHKSVSKQNPHLRSSEVHAILNHVDSEHFQNGETGDSKYEDHHVSVTHNGGSHGESVVTTGEVVNEDEGGAATTSGVGNTPGAETGYGTLPPGKRKAKIVRRAKTMEDVAIGDHVYVVSDSFEGGKRLARVTDINEDGSLAVDLNSLTDPAAAIELISIQREEAVPFVSLRDELVDLAERLRAETLGEIEEDVVADPVTLEVEPAAPAGPVVFEKHSVVTDEAGNEMVVFMHDATSNKVYCVGQSAPLDASTLKSVA